jgi:hypothetical protein
MYEPPGVVATVCEITPGALPQQLFRSTRRSPSVAAIELGTLESESDQSTPPPLAVQPGIVSDAPKYPIGAQRSWLFGQPPLIPVVPSYPSSKLPFWTRLLLVACAMAEIDMSHKPTNRERPMMLLFMRITPFRNRDMDASLADGEAALFAFTWTERKAA